MGLKIYWTWPCPSEQDPVFPTASPSHHEASMNLLSSSIRGEKEWKPHSRKPTKLITWITALSTSMKQWAMSCRAAQDKTGHGGEFWQNVVHWRREWQTTSVFLPWKYHENYEKAKRYDTERWTPQIGKCPICYWRRAEKKLQKEWREWAKAETMPSCECI